MSSDDIGPTREWQAKTRHVKPEVSRDKDRRAYRRVSMVETLFNRGELEYAHLRAAERLARHMEGALGYDVRGLDPAEISGGASTEFPRTRHANELEDAKRQITPREFSALQMLILELGTVESIGRQFYGARDKAISRARGVGLVVGGLERLALHWNFISRERGST